MQNFNGVDGKKKDNTERRKKKDERVALKDLEDFREDVETCFGTSCNFCERDCPAYQINKIKTFTSRGRNRAILGILDGRIEPSQEMIENFYQCTLCGSCERWCALPDTHLGIALRSYLVEHGYTNPVHEKNVKRIVETGNPYGSPDRFKWREGIEFAKSGAGNAMLLFGGCTMPVKQPETLEAVVELLGAENIQVMEDEPCCGSYALRTGYRDVFLELNNTLADYVERKGIKEIVAPCAGCLSTIKETFEEMGMDDVSVLSVAEAAGRLYAEGKLKFRKVLGKVTYHDPCHLGRLSGVFEEPRELVRAVAEELVEMEHNRYESLCCGAGGGVRAGYGELSDEMARRRLAEAKATGAEALLTICPFCELQFKRVGEENPEHKIPVKNLVDVLYEART